jgi:hypothetical protein
MRVRALLVATAVVLGTGAAAADAAAPTKTCNLVKDATGDVSNEYNGVGVFQPDAGLDLLGADVVSDSKNMTAVIRLAAEPGTATVYAKRYIAQVKVAGLANPLVLAAAITPTGTAYSFGYYGTTTTGTGYNYSATAANGKIEGKVITVSTSLANVASMAELGVIKKGAKINGFTLTANRRVPAFTQVTGQVIVADDAFGKGSYFAGGPSCIKPFAG